MTSSHSSIRPVLDGGNSNATNQRAAWVEVDLNQLESNMQIIKKWLKKNAQQTGVNVPQIMAVVKAAAYGHGAVAISEVLYACGVSWLGVASADEGSELRNAGCKLPILILGPTPPWAIVSALEHGLDLTISSLNQLHELNQQLAKHQRTVPIHLKVDTGMHRLGMNMEDIKKAIALLKENKKFKLVSVFSHLATASDSQTTKIQKENFDRFIAIFNNNRLRPDFYHLACSEAINIFPTTYYDMVRVGLYLYGMEPNTSTDEKRADLRPPLQPILSVRGRINQINSIDKGESIGYGLTWKATRPTSLANIPIGYADGVDRRLANKMQGLLHGKLINQVGTISMDQMLFDITDISQAREGDIITIIGSDEFEHGRMQCAPTSCLYLADWADKLGTLVRELSCRLHMRLPRIYTRRSMPKHIEGK